MFVVLCTILGATIALTIFLFYYVATYKHPETVDAEATSHQI